MVAITPCRDERLSVKAGRPAGFVAPVAFESEHATPTLQVSCEAGGDT